MDIAGFVHAVDVAKRSSHGKAVADLRQSLIGIGDLFGFRIQIFGFDVGVVDTVFLTAGDAELDLKGHPKRLHALQILDADIDVFFDWFFG